MSRRTAILFPAILVAAAVQGCNVLPAPCYRSDLDRNRLSAEQRQQDAAKLARAEALIDELKYPQAEEILREIVDRFINAGDVPHASRSLFWLGFCAEKLSRSSEAIEKYDLVEACYPGTPAAAQASRRKKDLIDSESE